MPPIDGYVTTMASAVLSAGAVGIAGFLVKQIRELAAMLTTLKESQRNQLKNTIVHVYEQSYERGYITPMDLETLNRNADSYYALGGNNYVHVIVGKANELPVHGMAIPMPESCTHGKSLPTLTAAQINERAGQALPQGR